MSLPEAYIISRVFQQWKLATHKQLMTNQRKLFGYVARKIYWREKYRKCCSLPLIILSQVPDGFLDLIAQSSFLFWCHHPPLPFGSWVITAVSPAPLPTPTRQPSVWGLGNFATVTLGFVNMFGGETGWAESKNQKLFKDSCMIRVHGAKAIWRTQVRAPGQGTCLGISQRWLLGNIRGR